MDGFNERAYKFREALFLLLDGESMSKHTGKAKRIFNNMTTKRPTEKNKRKKAKIKLFNTRQQSKLKARKVDKQISREYQHI